MRQGDLIRCVFTGHALEPDGNFAAAALHDRLGAAGERIEFDHEMALINGGENRETNLRALRRPCHAVKTKADVAEKAKVARVRSKHLGLHRPKATLPGSRGDKWKRKVGGQIVRRDEK